jgi:type I restriction enzyme, S subunit
MKATTISSSLLADEGRRLGPRAFVDGSIAARKRIHELPYRRLKDVTAGFKGGIFTHLFSPKRTYVSSREYGVPFLGASSMLLADLSGLPLISKNDADSRSYRPLAVREGMTLISCSGSVGRMVYARSDMNGMISAGDILKVQPDPTAIRSGYLFAFLSSRYGRLLINAGTYGTIVQHLEPQHIADLPVPRLGDEVERSTHELVEGAANLRVSAARMLAATVQELEHSGGLQPLPPSTSPTPFSCTTVSATALQERLDAFFHSPYGNSVVGLLKAGHLATTTVAFAADSIVEPARFKRIRTDNPKYGVRFFGTSALMWSEPIEAYYLPKAQPGMDQYIVSERTVLVPRSGQLSGIIGTAVLPYGDIIGGAVSEDAIRINCPDPSTAGFVFVALTSQYGLRQLKARAYGSSIPHLDVYQIGRVVLPDPGKKMRRRIGDAGAEVARLRDEAVAKDREARALVERAIEEAA